LLPHNNHISVVIEPGFHIHFRALFSSITPHVAAAVIPLSAMSTKTSSGVPRVVVILATLALVLVTSTAVVPHVGVGRCDGHHKMVGLYWALQCWLGPGEFTKGHEFDSKTEPKAMIGRRLSQAEAKSLVATLELSTSSTLILLFGKDPTHHCEFIHDAYEHTYDRNHYDVHDGAPLQEKAPAID
jgi:hypothetical protein